MKLLPPILYAEDNENDIQLTLSAFKTCGLTNQIVVVRNGNEAIEYLTYKGPWQSRDKVNPVLVLLDIKMPELDGIQTLKIIKSDKELKIIPVVMMTSSNMESDLMESYQLGANAYIVKPVDFNEFIKTVNQIGVFWAIINKTI